MPDLNNDSASSVSETQIVSENPAKEEKASKPKQPKAAKKVREKKPTTEKKASKTKKDKTVKTPSKKATKKATPKTTAKSKTDRKPRDKRTDDEKKLVILKGLLNGKPVKRTKICQILSGNPKLTDEEANQMTINYLTTEMSETDKTLKREAAKFHDMGMGYVFTITAKGKAKAAK